MSNTNLLLTYPANRFERGGEYAAFGRDMEAARHVQSRLFPCRHPRIDGLEYYGESRPACQIGGDFFDFQVTRSRSLLASVGDVTGHGVSSALLMSAIQIFLRGVNREESSELTTSVESLNRCLYEISPDNLYATLFYARVDPIQRKLHYVNAGHEPALLLRSRVGRVVRLDATGTVIGAFGKIICSERDLPLEPGDVLVVFTDGVPEAVNGEGRELGERGLLEIIETHADASPAGLVSHILDAVNAFTNSAGPVDDQTVSAIRFDEAAPMPDRLRCTAELEPVAA